MAYTIPHTASLVQRSPYKEVKSKNGGNLIRGQGFPGQDHFLEL